MSFVKPWQRLRSASLLPKAYVMPLVALPSQRR